MEDCISSLAAKRPDLQIHNVSFSGVSDINQVAYLVVNVLTNEAYLINGRERNTQFGLYMMDDRRLTSFVCGCCGPVADPEKVKELVVAYSIRRIYVGKPWDFKAQMNGRSEGCDITYIQEDIHLLFHRPS